MVHDISLLQVLSRSRRAEFVRGLVCNLVHDIGKVFLYMSDIWQGGREVLQVRQSDSGEVLHGDGQTLHKFCAKFVHPHAAEWLRDHCLTFGDGICLSGGWDSRRHHIVYCLKKGGMLSDFVKVIMCNI